MLEILVCGKKIETNSRNSVQNHPPEEKTTRNSVPWNKKEANFRNSVLKDFTDKPTLSIMFAGPEFFPKHIFSYNSIPIRASELTLP